MAPGDSNNSIAIPINKIRNKENFIPAEMYSDRIGLPISHVAMSPP
ncbi:MAG: hypothetical protein HN838_08380 [Rhodospirillaceae bacterium]|nr:hypothetical protein [Rhodospirillaceae bacterium]